LKALQDLSPSSRSLFAYPPAGDASIRKNLEGEAFQ
jgi:hypothetical protein